MPILTLTVRPEMRAQQHYQEAVVFELVKPPLARLIAQNAAGEGIDPSKETIAEFAQRWDRDWLSLNVSPKSLERYRQILRLYVVPYIGAMRSQKLRAVHCPNCMPSSFVPVATKGGPWLPRPWGTPTVSCIACWDTLPPGAL